MFLQEHERFLRSVLITHFKSSRRGESRLFTLHCQRTTASTVSNQSRDWQDPVCQIPSLYLSDLSCTDPDGSGGRRSSVQHVLGSQPRRQQLGFSVCGSLTASVSVQPLHTVAYKPRGRISPTTPSIRALFISLARSA